jgi:hypothetical protein
MQNIFARERDLEEELKKVQLYHKNQDELLSRLSQERITLQNAATMLEKQARENNPRLHGVLGDRYPSLSGVEQMALLLLEHLEGNGCKVETIDRLCCEMTTWSVAEPTQFRQPRSLKPR